jgi:hypothetical protein
MFLTFALVSVLTAAPQDTLPVPTVAPDTNSARVVGPMAVEPVGIGAAAAIGDTTPARRRKAVEVSDAYAVRLKIHYIASYATIPIFAAQAIVGEQLFNTEQNGYPPSHALKDTHDAIAVALGGLFAVNTVTGVWNWWETRHQEKGRTWRTIHGALMLLADAGFATTAVLGSNAKFEGHGGNPARDLHRNWAEASASVALVSYVMMWKPFRKD